MNRSIALIACVIFLLGNSCGSSSGSESCSLDINDFTNGANAAAAVSVWSCRSSGASSSYTFAFYDDGTGYGSTLGAFTWSETGCQQVDVAAYNGTNQIRDIEGSIASGIGTFRQIQPNGTESTASCTLQSLSASTSGDPGKSETSTTLSLHLENSCYGREPSVNINLIELINENGDDLADPWILRDTTDNSSIAIFYEDQPFRMADAECLFNKESGVECDVDDCIFVYK